MNISPISYNQRVTMRANSETPVTPATPSTLSTGHSAGKAALKAGAANGAVWFGVGVLFDRCINKLAGSKTPLKSSLIINGIIGLGMGAFAYSKALKSNK